MEQNLASMGSRAWSANFAICDRGSTSSASQHKIVKPREDAEMHEPFDEDGRAETEIYRLGAR